MILGLVTVVTLMAIRLNRTPGPVLPAAIALPEGAQARAVTVGEGWVAVVSDQGEILIFDATTGALRQTVAIQPSSDR